MQTENHSQTKISLLKIIFAVLLIVTITVFSYIAIFYKQGKHFSPEHTQRQQQLEEEQSQQMMMSLIIMSS